MNCLTCRINRIRAFVKNVKTARIGQKVSTNCMSSSCNSSSWTPLFSSYHDLFYFFFVKFFHKYRVFTYFVLFSLSFCFSVTLFFVFVSLFVFPVPLSCFHFFVSLFLFFFYSVFVSLFLFLAFSLFCFSVSLSLFLFQWFSFSICFFLSLLLYLFVSFSLFSGYLFPSKSIEENQQTNWQKMRVSLLPTTAREGKLETFKWIFKKWNENKLKIN